MSGITWHGRWRAWCARSPLRLLWRAHGAGMWPLDWKFHGLGLFRLIFWALLKNKGPIGSLFDFLFPYFKRIWNLGGRWCSLFESKNWKGRCRCKRRWLDSLSFTRGPCSLSTASCLGYHRHHAYSSDAPYSVHDRDRVTNLDQFSFAEGRSQHKHHQTPRKSKNDATATFAWAMCYLCLSNVHIQRYMYIYIYR